jgi:hypothetical protein
MTMPPRLLIDSSIHQLQALSALLTDELGEWRTKSRTPSPQAVACKEILLTISVLIPKLQAARYVVGENQPERSGGNPEKRQWRDAGQPELPGKCEECEDS